MKKAIYMMVCFMSFIACQNQTQEHSTSNSKVKSVKLDVSAFKTKLANTPNAQLIDVRTPEEFEGGHIEGAKNLNFYNDSFEMALDKLTKGQPVFVYCKSGGRSGKCYENLHKMGFKEVYDLKGGYTAWKTAK